MQLVIKALDSASDDPSFVIIEESDARELDHDHAFRMLSRGSKNSVSVGATPIWRELRWFRARTG